MHIPYFVRRVNRVFTNPLIGTFAWFVPPLAVVHHVGRKSGRRYRTPVVAFPSSTGFVIPMTYGRDVDWARNMVKADGCELRQTGRRFELHNPRIVGFKAAAKHLPAVVRPALGVAAFPGYVLLDFEGKKSSRNRRRSAKARRH